MKRTLISNGIVVAEFQGKKDVTRTYYKVETYSSYVDDLSGVVITNKRDTFIPKELYDYLLSTIND